MSEKFRLRRTMMFANAQKPSLCAPVDADLLA